MVHRLARARIAAADLVQSILVAEPSPGGHSTNAATREAKLFGSTFWNPLQRVDVLAVVGGIDFDHRVMASAGATPSAAGTSDAVRRQREPMPEWPTPDHGSRGLTRSQQFQ